MKIQVQVPDTENLEKNKQKKVRSYKGAKNVNMAV